MLNSDHGTWSDQIVASTPSVWKFACQVLQVLLQALLSTYICFVNTEVKRKTKPNPARIEIYIWLKERKSIAFQITKCSQQFDLLGLLLLVAAFVPLAKWQSCHKKHLLLSSHLGVGGSPEVPAVWEQEGQKQFQTQHLGVPMLFWNGCCAL